jgi:hypothetical protein
MADDVNIQILQKNAILIFNFGRLQDDIDHNKMVNHGTRFELFIPVFLPKYFGICALQLCLELLPPNLIFLPFSFSRCQWPDLKPRS